jgi:hypothetical protein
LVAAYALIDSQLRIGSPWLLTALMLALLLPILHSRRIGNHDVAHYLGLVSHTVATAAVAGSVTILGKRVLDGGEEASNLLRDAALLWISNVLVFSLWYWQLDGGGPDRRHMHGYVPTDFVFPQSALGESFVKGWSPRYIDYLFIAFNTSSAFSPTDTLTLSGRAKVLMMVQSLISIVALAVLGARAINTLR